MDFQMNAASIIGAKHQRVQKNCQDGLATGQIEQNGITYMWGILCDGCSGGNHSEVGAKLLSRYLSREIGQEISLGANFGQIPQQIYMAAQGFFRLLAAEMSGSPQERVDFIRNYLLCTVMGFVMSDSRLVIFTAGDGIVIVNDQVDIIDQNDKPIYPAYHLVERSKLPKDIRLSLGFSEDCFDLESDSVSLEKFAICTDGFEKQHVDELWGHESSRELMCRLRVLRLRKEAVFADDCSVIAVEKLI